MHIKQSLYKLLLRTNLISYKIIVVIDGGICSQMCQYLLGHMYKERGFKVAYDLSFYKEWGMDLNKEYVRNFDLLKAFPNMCFKEATEFEIAWYRKRYYYDGNNIDDLSFLELKPPIYLGGYYHFPSEMWRQKFRNLYKVDYNILDTQNRLVLDEIQSRSCSVGVHVRRGDLKEEIVSYGKPATLDYFQKAINFFIQRDLEPFFYIFSDEPQWVLGEMLPRLLISRDKVRIVDINSSDRGFVDLFLLAACSHQIASKGSLGKFGALLADNPDKIVILCDDVTQYYWKSLLQNVIFL